MPESRMIGKYEILEEIGRGGFAVVYRARDPKLKREVALKVLHESHARRPEVVQRFLDEASRAAGLNHPGIVHINEVDEYNGQPFIAMDYLPGGTLAQRLHDKPLPMEAALLILEQLAAALDYAHKRNLIHRDVKPANILFNEDDRAVLVDFGLVKSLIDSGYTVDGTSLGTPQYMSPEQAQGGSVDARSDVYVFGIVAYEMLTGHVPFQADTPLAVVNAQINVAPPDPHQANNALDESIGAVLLKALSKTSTDRYDSAGALVAALHVAHEENVRRAQQQSELAQLIEQAQVALAAKDWLKMQGLCVQIMQIDRAHPDALAWMTEAATELQRENAEEAVRRQRIKRYEEGEAALNAGQWQTAIAAFEEVEKGNKDFREVQQKLAQAREEVQRAQWYDEAIALGEAQRWSEACRTWVDLLRQRPDYRDGFSRLLDAVEHLMPWFTERLKEQGVILCPTCYAANPRNTVFCEQCGLQLAVIVVPATSLSFPDSVATVLATNLLLWRCDNKEMVRVPAGEFLYGDPKEKVTLSEFWIDKTPVTNAEYARFVAATQHAAPEHWRGQQPPKDLIDHPVAFVSWDDATGYAQWAGKRLPTEQEWEKAARGTDGRAYPWGDEEPTGKLCNFGMNVKSTTPVGKYSPQGDGPYGCVDMVGNVWEWTASDYDQSNKVIRGGSWFHVAHFARCSSRRRNSPDNRDDNLGFRCVLQSP
jgi:tRNA A-37 threonylcarbamoyl transferase component Bud32